MLSCFTQNKSGAIPIIPLTAETFPAWLKKQNKSIRNWVANLNFTAQPETYCLIAAEDGSLRAVLFAVKDLTDFWSYGLLPTALPTKKYSLTEISDPNLLSKIAMVWGLAAYKFTRYKKNSKTYAQLVLPKNGVEIANQVEIIYHIRDLINTPTEEMGPEQLAHAVVACAKKYHAKVTQIKGDELVKNNYHLIHAVGRASVQTPRLVDLRWGKTTAPKVTLIGKGVCFDSGGLDLKNSANMQLMRKDMAGAATALGLAQMIMTANLPIRLRLLIPAVENAVAGNAFRPGDIFSSRKGITVEIGNTDAEGRLILADALAEAVSEKPELIIDFATLTGAARVALGPEISTLFCNNDELAEELQKYGLQEQDPIWRLPLYAAYRKMLDSQFADINNASESGFAGAITAALFLKEFVPDDIPWAHFDLMAWNVTTRPGRPAGGEAMALRAVFAYLSKKFPTP